MHPFSPPSRTLSSIEVSPSDVYQALGSLDPSKSTGIDGIGPRVLKFCSAALVEPVHHLFSVSLSTGSLPEEWRTHIITPVFTSGSKSDITNYRPISLLCVISKVLEKIIYDKITPFISASINHSQFGFMKGKSCLQQLLLLLNQIHSSLSHSSTDVVYLDISKAFDSVPHNVLLAKFESLGISGLLLKWLQAYLSGRCQVVSVNGCRSSSLPVLSGVPQGSILGPLMFLVYINDLPCSVVHSSPLLFADDTKCAYTLPTGISASPEFQADLDALHHWSVVNGLKFNDKKSVCMRFSRMSDTIQPVYTLDGVPIKVLSGHRDLGVMFSSDLSWSDHIDYVTAKCYKVIGLLRRAFSSSLPVLIKKQLYLLLVRSHLSYCSVLWWPHLLKDVEKLENIQRRATKYILNDYVSDYKSRLISLNLLPLSMVLELNDIVFFLRSLQSPSDSFDILQFVSFSSTCTRSSSGFKLKHTPSTTNYGRHFYFVRLRNALPTPDTSLSTNVLILRIKSLFWSHFLQNFNPNNNNGLAKRFLGFRL